MTHAVISDVEVRLGRPPASEEERHQWDAWIEDVEAIIASRFNLDAAVAAGRPTVATVRLVVANAVIRKVNNPTGKRSERIDDYYYDYGEGSRAIAGLYLTDEEWALLAPAGLPDGAFTIHPYGDDRRRGEWLHPDVWVPLP